MKFLIVLAMIFSLNVFAESQRGYNCIPENNVEGMKLDKVKAKLGRDYLQTIGVVTVRPETCSLNQIMIYRDICKAGKSPVSIGPGAASEIVVSRGKIIRVLCEVDIEVGTYPGSGGSN